MLLSFCLLPTSVCDLLSDGAGQAFWGLSGFWVICDGGEMVDVKVIYWKKSS